MVRANNVVMIPEVWTSAAAPRPNAFNGLMGLELWRPGAMRQAVEVHVGRVQLSNAFTHIGHLAVEGTAVVL
jgi:hypothetical protein